MPEQNLASEVHKLLHDMRQPLGTIRMNGANIRIRCTPALDDEKAAYLQGKLERIDQQVEQVAVLLDKLGGLFEVAG